MQVGDLVTLSAYAKRLVAFENFTAGKVGVLIEITPLRYRVRWSNGLNAWHIRREIKKIKKV